MIRARTSGCSGERSKTAQQPAFRDAGAVRVAVNDAQGCDRAPADAGAPRAGTAVAGVGPYLPFGLVDTLLGVEPDHTPGPAIALLAAYAALLALGSRRWALARDLT